MSLNPLAFTGVSSLSADLQTILSRAVSIASIPLQSLQNQDADVLQRKTELAGLSVSVAAFAESLTEIGKQSQNRALKATSSNTSMATVSNTGATEPGTYTINEITSIAKLASETTLSSYADSGSTEVSSTGLLKLWVDGESFDIDITAENNLVGLRDAINAQNAGVTATILTTETGSYLTVTATGTGEKPIALKDDPAGVNADLLSDTNHGSNAVFKLNGISVTQGSNTVNNIIPGLTFTLAATTASAVTLNLSTDRSSIATAIERFVNGYNELAKLTAAQVGPAAGLLSGDFVVRQIQQYLRETAGFNTAAGSIRNLADLGILFDKNGQATFDKAAFDALSIEQIDDVLDFFDESAGLGALSEKFEELSDPLTGLIKLQQTSYDETDRRLQNEIAILTERIDRMQSALSAKLQAADALLSQLESQQKMLDASLKSIELMTYGKNDSR